MARKKFLEYVWEKCIKPQESYGFSIPHDVAYSIEAVQEANLATRFNPLFWECACLSINAGNTSTNFETGEGVGDEPEESSDASLASSVKTGAPNYAKISKAISDSQLRGVNIELPDINTAQADFIPDIKNNGILYSLKNVAAVSDDLFSRIIAARPYSSIEDFYNRVQPTEAEMVGLIKAGCFCSIDKRAVRAQLIWFLNKRTTDLFPVRDKITSVQLKKMLTAKASLPGYENELRVCNFYAYVKQKQYDKEKKRYFLNERDVLAFWNRYFEPLMNLSKGDYSPIPEGYCVKPTAIDKAYKKLIEPLTNYLNSPEGAEKFADWERSLEMKKLGEKYGISESQSAWEMEQLAFYHSGHELQGVIAERYSIRDFSKLPETPTYKTFEKDGQTIKVPENVWAIAGTVVGSDNTKHIVNLLTLAGVVNVKMYAEMYNKFKAKISVIDKDTGKKKVLDDSWFKRGTKLLIYGYRREDTFVAKNVKVNGYPRSVILINKKNDDGSLDLCFSRNMQ